MKTIGIKEEIFDRLKEWKNKKAFLGKKSSFSFSDAIEALLDESDTLSEWMKGKK